MALCQLARVGSLGHVGRFASLDRVCYPRHARVILRTARGLEIGEVLSGGEEMHRRQTDGTILRGVTAEDMLLETRLKKHQQQAFEACTRRLAELGSQATLMDAELLFDGRSLFFYFLGDPSAELEDVVAELAEVYEAKAQVRQFAETLLAGCGPDCGTAAAGGGGCGSCGVGCAVAGACGVGGRS
jgi:cell fate regulator YaaT (PSP1 superfamily)